MILVHAPGGGLGHLTRVLAARHTLAWRGDTTILTSSTRARSLEPPAGVDVRPIPRDAAGDRGALRTWLLDREDLDRTLEKRVADLRARVPILAPLALKEARRGRDLDALNFYHGLVLRPLVEILRIAHCPERWDYGLRYLDRDLPDDVHATLRDLAFVTSSADIERRYPEAMAMFDQTARSIRQA